MDNSNLPLQKTLDNSRLGAFQLTVIVICCAIAALDGFDTQSIAFVAPALRHTWDVPPALFGPLFGAGLFGTMVGSIALGSLADRWGRKPIIVFSTALFGVMSLLCATATSIEVLGAYRFVAGLGLGGVIPNLIALVSEYAPKRVRSTAIVVTFAGFPMGAVLGGIASSRIIPAFGWEMVFILGGVLPLILIPIILVWIPESLRYLAVSGAPMQKIDKIIARIDSTLVPVDESSIRIAGGRAEAQPVRSLFTQGRLAWTALLWMLTFTSLLLAYFLVNWTPLLLVESGVPQDKAILGVVALNLGGIIGSIIIGRISDKRGPFFVMGLAFGVGAVFVAAVGFLIESAVPVLLALILVVGLCVFGAQLNITALSANYYPVYMRSTGVGWSMGLGRVGSIVGPTVGGALIALGLARGELFLCAAVPAAIAAICIFALSFNVPPAEESRDESTTA
ncbi:MAG: MFS transporter [Gammaproteobacteria bacterium]|nr:MFS transporter [Gammaproteobacteria bacterium]